MIFPVLRKEVLPQRYGLPQPPSVVRPGRLFPPSGFSVPQVELTIKKRLFRHIRRDAYV
jgi:hypothetical protein